MISALDGQQINKLGVEIQSIAREIIDLAGSYGAGADVKAEDPAGGNADHAAASQEILRSV